MHITCQVQSTKRPQVRIGLRQDDKKLVLVS